MACVPVGLPDEVVEFSRPSHLTEMLAVVLEGVPRRLGPATRAIRGESMEVRTGLLLVDPLGGEVVTEAAMAQSITLSVVANYVSPHAVERPLERHPAERVGVGNLDQLVALQRAQPNEQVAEEVRNGRLARRTAHL